MFAKFNRDMRTRSVIRQQQSQQQPPLDDSLTSLNWLHEIQDPLTTPSTSKQAKTRNALYQQRQNKTACETVTTAFHHAMSAAAAPPPLQQIVTSTIPINTQQRPQINSTTLITQHHHQQQPQHHSPELLTKLDPKLQDVDYTSNPHSKPPFNYQQLIYIAMTSSKTKKLTMNAVCDWIQNHFMYYRVADVSWQNSIRHALSVSKNFERIAKRKNDGGGRGGYWTLSGTCEKLVSDEIIRHILKKTSASNSKNSSPQISSSSKRLKLDLSVTTEVNDLLKGDWDQVFKEIDSSDAARLLRDTELSSPLDDATLQDLLLDDITNEFNETEQQLPDIGKSIDLTVFGNSINKPSWWNPSDWL